jgi:hypothetical protein
VQRTAVLRGHGSREVGSEICRGHGPRIGQRRQKASLLLPFSFCSWVGAPPCGIVYPFPTGPAADRLDLYDLDENGVPDEALTGDATFAFDGSAGRTPFR